MRVGHFIYQNYATVRLSTGYGNSVSILLGHVCAASHKPALLPPISLMLHPVSLLLLQLASLLLLLHPSSLLLPTTSLLLPAPH